MQLNRRTALKGALGGALVAGPFAGFANAAALSRTGALAGAALGTLVPVQDARDGVVRLHLPAGFSYRSFHDTSAPVTLPDGTRLPAGVRPHQAVRQARRRRHDHDPGHPAR
jgi:hypothetical protein